MNTFKIISLLVVILFISFAFTNAESQEAIKEDVKAKKFCTSCELLVGYIEQYANKSEDAIIKELDNVCATVLPGTLKIPCELLVNEYGKSLIDQVLKAETPEKVCSQLHFCDASQRPVESISEVKQSQLCTTCETVVSYAEQYLNKSRPEVVKELVIACGKLPLAYQQICDTLVVNYADVLIDYLLDNQDPNKFCQEFGLCSSSQTEKVVVPPKQVTSNPLECSLCKFLVGGVEKYIGSNHTEEEIKKGLNYVCAHIPSSFTQQCEAIVEQYSTIIIELIVQKFPADVVCQKIKLCDASSKVAEPVKLPFPVKSSQYCALCVEVTTFAENYIANNKTEANIIEALKKVCDYVPSLYTDQCKAILPFLVDSIVQKLLAEEPPKKICEQLSLCTNTTRTLEQYSSLDKCNVCKDSVAVIDHFITKNSTEQEIIKVTEKVCQYLPSSYQPICVLVFEQYGAEIVTQLVAKVLDPTQVCDAVHLCTEQQQQIVKTIEQLHKSPISIN